MVFIPICESGCFSPKQAAPNTLTLSLSSPPIANQTKPNNTTQNQTKPLTSKYYNNNNHVSSSFHFSSYFPSLAKTHTSFLPSSSDTTMEQIALSQQEEDLLVSDCESIVSGTETTETMRQEDASFGRLPEGDVLHDLIKRGFVRGLGQLGPKTEVLSIHRNTCSGAVSQARLQSFQLHARAVAKLREGNSNVKYAWYGTRGEDDVNDIVSHGFAHVHGPQLLLSPDDAPLQSVRGCVVGKDGVRHVLLCRVILGRSELVDGGTEQCYPSSQNYDSGVDSFSAPSKYIIWSNRMNTHVLPAYVISFRVPSFKGIEKSEELLRPSSPWMPFPTLISVLSKVLASRDIALISKFYKDKKDKKISRHELIQRVRQIAGDKLLFAVIKSYREKKKQRFQHTRSKNGQATTHEF